MTTTEYQNTIYRIVNYITSDSQVTFKGVHSIGKNNEKVYISYKRFIDRKYVELHFTIDTTEKYYKIYITEISGIKLTDTRMIDKYDTCGIDFDNIDRTIMSLISQATIEVERKIYDGDM